MAKARRWCKSCHRYVLAETDPPDKQFMYGQCFLTLITCGLWFPIFLLLYMSKANSYLCHRCGRKTGWRRV